MTFREGSMDTFWNHTMYKAIVIFLLFNLAGTSTYQSMAATLIAGIGVIICLVALTKWYFGGGVCKSKARLRHLPLALGISNDLP